MLEPAEVAEFIIALGTLPPLYYDPENVRELKRIAKCVFDLVEIAPHKTFLLLKITLNGQTDQAL